MVRLSKYWNKLVKRLWDPHYWRLRNQRQEWWNCILFTREGDGVSGHQPYFSGSLCFLLTQLPCSVYWRDFCAGTEDVLARKARETFSGFLEHGHSLGFSSVREHLVVFVCGLPQGSEINQSSNCCQSQEVILTAVQLVHIFWVPYRKSEIQNEFILLI